MAAQQVGIDLIQSDRTEIARFYQELSTQIRLFGAEEMGRRYVVIRLARMEANGHVDYSDLQRILARVRDIRTWYPAWAEEAEQAEAEGERFLGENRSVSAADMFLRASGCYHWAQHLARIGSPERTEGRAGRVRMYRRAIEHLDASIRPFEISYLGATLPGYLHLPRRVTSDREELPCVIMVNGADSVKEEYHNWAQQFVRRGMAVVTFDGPGQGEMVGVLPMRPEAWEEPMKAVVDALLASNSVRVSRIGAWGSSMGGFLVSRAAGFEPRIQAAISLGGFYDFRDFPFWALSTQLNVMEDLMVDSVAGAREYIARTCTLAGAADRIACPYLVIHGARDELVTIDEASQMAAEAPQGEFICFEDGFHTCTNYNSALICLMCDWMASKLSAQLST